MPSQRFAISEHPLRTLREYLKRMLWTQRHHREHLINRPIGQRLVKQVAHRIDEHASGLAPVQWIFEVLCYQFDFTGPLRMSIRDLDEAVERALASSSVFARGDLMDRIALCEPRCRALRVTIAAALRYARTSSRRVPGYIGPLDCSDAHGVC